MTTAIRVPTRLTCAVVLGIGMISGGSLALAQQAKPVIPPTDVVRPVGTTQFAVDADKVRALGIAQHANTQLSPLGRSCDTCHAAADSYKATFVKPWPHRVASVRRKTGLDKITAEGMVQFCMISAMGGRPLAWDSEALTALTAFVLERHEKVVVK